MEEYLEKLECPVTRSELEQRFPDVDALSMEQLLNQVQIRNKIYKITLSFPKTCPVNEITVKYRHNQKPQTPLHRPSLQPSHNFQQIHELNKLKDMCSVVFGRIAEMEGKMIREVYDEFGVPK